MLEITLPRIKNTKTQGNYASYDIEPLEAGYGMTLGNALRRVLLSSLPGAAVTSIRIDGVQHEFQDIPHVMEDVTEIVLNVKKLRLRSFSDHAVSMRLEVSGERVVTAADIMAPSTIEIVNPDLYIATLDNENARLDMELVIESGKGYVPADSKEDQPIGVIPVDAIYTPVQKVNYNVEHTRVGQMTNFDKIVLDIWTDGTITPDEALRQSADILVRHFTQLANYRAVLAEPEKPPLSSMPIPPKIYETPIEELDLSVRAYNCLKRSNITKVGQVLSMNEDDLLGVRNFGEKSLQELREKLLLRNFLPNPRTSAVGADMDGDQEMEE
ncbi:MAG: DNA-directed RNA polymerase subunit alpha [Chloroflexi bacterium]|nr:MAG: DNA-directed RNA polymerase subunit alpha [Chloroflexota bacterium]TMF47022.1 MAG: DNA-directed RNA polymerase subunit alpha [Chloroflexota bacterium]